MKICAIQQKNNVKLSFQRAFTKPEMDEYKQILPEALNKTGEQDKFIFIVHDICLPQNPKEDIGVGNITTKKAQDFFKYIKDYLGINRIEILPQGEAHIHKNNSFCCPYSGSALSLGSHIINPELLTHDEYGNILTSDEFNKLVKSNNASDKEKIANLENVIENDSNLDKTLRKAFNRFNSKDNQAIKNLRQEFNQYKSENKDWLEPKSIYSILYKENNNKHWQEWNSDLDKNLYAEKYSLDKKTARKNEILSKNKEDFDFYQFKQFLAEKHLAQGKKELNQKGLKLIGDCLINFAPDEVWANQNAFYKDGTVGWGLKALKYYDISPKKDSDAKKLLTKKVNLFAKRYDGIRFDVGWMYSAPRIFFPNNNYEKLEMKDSIFKVIEDEVKKVKGENYPLKDLLYEVDSDSKDFSLYDGNRLKSSLENRTKVFNSNYLSESWGGTKAFTERGFNPDYFMTGSNHDSLPIRDLAENMPEVFNGSKTFRKFGQQYTLSKIFHYDEKTLENPVEFMKTKFAEILSAKNKMIFYMDAFGRKELFNQHNGHTRKDFRYRIPENFEQSYHKAVEEGFGLNMPDALERLFRLKGLDKTEETLYKKIVKFRDILNEPTQEIIKKSAGQKSKIILGTTAALGIIFGGIEYAYNKNKPKKSA